MSKFKTVKDYYLYKSQGNTFAPPFDELTEETKQVWIDEFKTELLKQE